MAVTFVDGPLALHGLALRRAPLSLRAVVDTAKPLRRDGYPRKDAVDALDLLDDEPRAHDNVVTMRDGTPWNDNSWKRWSGRRWRPLMKELNMDLRPYESATHVCVATDRRGPVDRRDRTAGGTLPDNDAQCLGHIFDRRVAA